MDELRLDGRAVDGLFVENEVPLVLHGGEEGHLVFDLALRVRGHIFKAGFDFSERERPTVRQNLSDSSVLKYLNDARLEWASLERAQVGSLNLCYAYELN